MRYDGCLLTETDSRRLIDEVDRWCRRTGTNYNKLVVVAQVGYTTRHKVRMKGRRVTIEVAERLRATMRAYRHGISREEYRAKPKPWSGARIRPLQAQVEPVRVDRSLCPVCNTRADIGCEHTRRFERQSAGR